MADINRTPTGAGGSNRSNGSNGSNGPTGSNVSGARGVSAGEFAGVGIQFAVVILVFTAAGVWLDRRLGTSPWFVIVCVFAGAAGGFYSMYAKLTKAQKRGRR